MFTLFTSWKRLPATSRNAVVRTRGSIGRGQALFTTFKFQMGNVAGLNHVQGLPVVEGTCATCHNAPNAGTFSLNETMNIGTEIFERQPDQPLYVLQNLQTGPTITTRDPGRALVTGRWADVGKFKVPSLRGLASRAPYFHNGSAETLEEVVDFYVRRFGIALRGLDVLDLAAFMRSL